MDAPIVTLTTDWGDRDFFAAMVKGRLCSTIAGVRVVDISHQQCWNDPATTIAIIRHGCTAFPAGTVHIVDVGCERQSAEGHGTTGIVIPLLVAWRGQYIISSDRKLMEQAIEDECDGIVELPLPEGVQSFSFLALDLYCGVAARLLAGEDMHTFGQPCEPLRRRLRPGAQMEGNMLTAMVTGIDSYGNANLNLTYDEFSTLRAGRRFRVKIERRVGISDRYEDITEVRRHYSDVRMGNILLTVSVTGQLQIAINKGSAAQLLGLGYASKCSFLFE